MRVGVALLLLLLATGCGPSATELRERTVSTLNTEADRWDGGKDFAPTATDAYGRPLTATVEKGVLSYTLELRSPGPDGLPKNSDDVVVSRSKRHGETTLTGEAAKGAESIAAGASSGLVKGVKKGLGFGGRGRVLDDLGATGRPNGVRGRVPLRASGAGHGRGRRYIRPVRVRP